MNKIVVNDLSLWQFPNMGKELSIHHFVTDRKSKSNDKEFTLSFSSSPDKEEIQGNRNLLATALGIPNSNLYFPSQVHTTRVVHVTSHTSKEELKETDALISNEKNVGLAVLSADCVPILLYDKKNNAIGAVHSGWRGTVAKILTKTLHEMKLKFGTQGEDVIAGIGPSACVQSYEVGEEVIHLVEDAFGKEGKLLNYQPNKKATFDLWQANKIQLLEFGVKDSSIEISGLCTVLHNKHFFSARQGDVGRFAAAIMLR